MNDLFELDAKKILVGIFALLLFAFVASNVTNHVTSAAAAKKESDKRAAQMRAIQEQEAILDKAKHRSLNALKF